MIEDPTRPTMDVSPAGEESDVRVVVQYQQQRHGQMPADPEKLCSRIPKRFCHRVVAKRQ